MRTAIVLALLLTGCSEASTELTAWQTSMREGSVDAIEATKAVEIKQDEAIVILKDNTASLTAIKTKIESLEASLVKSEPQNGKDGDPASAPSPPAKANTAATPLKLATPGDFSEETLVELASRLYARGVNVHNKTREELEAIDAQMQGVKSSPVQYQSRPTYQSGCPGGVCPVPQRVSRRGKR